MVYLGNHKKFRSTEEQDWVVRNEAQRQTDPGFQTALNALLRTLEFILRAMKVKGGVKTSNLIMLFPALEV